MSDVLGLLAIIVVLQSATLAFLVLHVAFGSRARAVTPVVTEEPAVWSQVLPPLGHEHVWPAEPFGSSENGQMQNYRCTVCGAVTSKAGAA